MQKSDIGKFKMLKWIKECFFHTIYTHIWRKRVSIYLIGFSKTFNECPHIVIDKNNIIIETIRSELYQLCACREYKD